MHIWGRAGPEEPAEASLPPQHAKLSLWSQGGLFPCHPSMQNSASGPGVGWLFFLFNELLSSLVRRVPTAPK